MLLGGGSLIALALVPLMWPKAGDNAGLVTAMLLLANLINHPHFAHSYQLFYRDFTSRAFGDRFPRALRQKYLFAGVGVPLLLVSFLSYAVVTGNSGLLGWLTNFMFFLVGWHYVKQGYGMLMVDAALKKNFFGTKDKNLLLWNAYAVWITSWMMINRSFSSLQYWELHYFSFNIPDWLFFSSVTGMAISTCMVIPVLIRKARSFKISGAPINGMIAYVVSLYVWLLARHPSMLLVIPAFHSLQYLAVVWRYRRNIEASKSNDKVRRRKGFALFVVTGFILGYAGFWYVPQWLGRHINYDQATFGGALFLFLFWVFINVHHYFLDNVMWRKDNPDTRLYLFGTH